MRIMGLDPGLAIVGFGIIDSEASRLTPVQYGTIQTPSRLQVPERLQLIYDAIKELLNTYQPEAVAVEQLFFNRNVTNAFHVGQARGVLLLAAVQQGLPVAEYTPMQVKQAVVGYGGADKRQVQEMVRQLLRLKERPRPDDVADALAVAMTHAQHWPLMSRIRERWGG